MRQFLLYTVETGTLVIVLEYTTNEIDLIGGLICHFYIAVI
jgi:hypothetical protein